MRISDWSSDVCSSDLRDRRGAARTAAGVPRYARGAGVTLRLSPHRPAPSLYCMGGGGSGPGPQPDSAALNPKTQTRRPEINCQITKTTAMTSNRWIERKNVGEGKSM